MGQELPWGLGVRLSVTVLRGAGSTGWSACTKLPGRVGQWVGVGVSLGRPGFVLTLRRSDMTASEGFEANLAWHIVTAESKKVNLIVAPLGSGCCTAWEAPGSGCGGWALPGRGQPSGA